MHRLSPRPAKKIYVTVLAIEAAFFLRPVPDAKIHALVLPFGHGHARHDLRVLMIGIDERHGRKLKQFEAVQTAVGCPAKRAG